MLTMKYITCCTLFSWFALIALVAGQARHEQTRSTNETTHSPATVLNTTCRGEPVNVKCGAGQTITWKSAQYKTSNEGHVCATPKGDTFNATLSPSNCSRNKTTFLNKHCGCNNNCSFTVDDTFFDGSPCPNKYVLKVRYRCKGPDNEVKTLIVNGRKQVDRPTSCANSVLIEIVSAIFRAVETVNDCSVDVTTNISQMCSSQTPRNTCSFYWAMLLQEYGDPCAGKFYTYLEFNYVCDADDATCLNEEENEVTEENVEDVVDALVTDIEESIKQEKDVDIAAVSEVLKSIIDVGSPSPNVTENVVKIVSAILTFDVSSNNVESANALSQILKSVEKQVTESVVKIVSAILTSDVSSNNVESAKALSQILKSVEKQVEKTLEKYGKFSSVQPNIAVEGVTVDETRDGVGFAINVNDKGFDESSSRNFDPSMQSEEGTDGHSIQLPKDALFETGDNDTSNSTKVSFIAYKDSKLFPSDSMVPCPVISAKVLGKDNVVNLDEPVVIQIEQRQVDGDDSNVFKCVYWDFSKRDGIGDWAEDGCELVSAESGKITCHCNHLTNFAVLVMSVTDENVEDVVNTLVTDIEESLQQEKDVDIAVVKDALESIIDVGSPSPNVTESVVKIVSAILSSNVSSQNEESAEALSEILKSVEKQVAKTLKKYGKFSSVLPNIAVEGVTVDEAQDGVGFAININDEGFDESSSRNFDPSMQTEKGTGGHSIQLPKDALFKTGDTDTSNGTKVSFIAYKDSKLFPSESMVPGPVISATVLGKDKVVNLEDPVIIQIEPRQIDEDDSNTFKCVYWNFSKRGDIGDWAEDGCELISAESGKITCQCDHLTNFAVLVDFSGEALSFTLDIISKVGCAVSILALCLTLMIFLCCRGLRLSLQRKILVQLCISMLGLYVAFLIGIDSTDSEIGCLSVAALLHYFVVTTMLWMGVEARHMYITLVSESARVSRKFMIRASIFAWGVGLIPVGVLLGIKQLNYRAPEYCFLALDEGLFYGLLLPIGLVLLHNIITFCLVARKLLSSRSYVMKSDLENLENDSGEVEYFQKTGVRDISQRLLNAFAVSILLGITWVFGFLAVEEAREVFQLLFCICNSFQGFFIFILFCVGQKDVRKIVCAKCVPDAPSHQPKVQKIQHKKPSAGVTSISSDTRVTGESYSEDNDTLATTI